MSAAKDQYLIFHLGQHKYALTVEPVCEIIEQPPLTALPEAPNYILGVFKRGERNIPVLDLRLKWKMPIVQTSPVSCIIVIESEKGPFAIRADNVTAIVTLQSGELQSIPAAARTEGNLEAVAGIANLAGIDVVVLSPEGLIEKSAA